MALRAPCRNETCPRWTATGGSCSVCAAAHEAGRREGIEAAAKWLEKTGQGLLLSTADALRAALLPTPPPQAAEAPGRHAGDPWNPPRPAPPAAPAGEGPECTCGFIPLVDRFHLSNCALHAGETKGTSDGK